MFLLAQRRVPAVYSSCKFVRSEKWFRGGIDRSSHRILFQSDRILLHYGNDSDSHDRIDGNIFRDSSIAVQRLVSVAQLAEWCARLLAGNPLSIRCRHIGQPSDNHHRCLLQFSNICCEHSTRDNWPSTATNRFCRATNEFHTHVRCSAIESRRN